MISLLDIVRSREFRFPLLVCISILTAFVSGISWFYGIAILIGIVQLLGESYERIRMNKWNLDYLAFLTLITALWLDAILAGAVISLMIAVSAGLEKYGSSHAEKTLRGLFANIPKKVLVQRGDNTIEMPIQSVNNGDVLIIRPQEMLAFEGKLISKRAILNEANLTGEIEPVTYREKSILQSGSINVGEALQIEVIGNFESSGYRKILSLVEEGKQHPSPMVRLAERYNFFFTFFALALAIGAYGVTNDWQRFLAVLVIATPCPLLIAVPVSFIGGLNKAARKNIIIKSPFVLELLAKTKTFFFDKTGTLTLGEPHLKKIIVHDHTYSQDDALAIAVALERYSFHPIAKAFNKAFTVSLTDIPDAQNVTEKMGEGIFGTVNGTSYRIIRAQDNTESGIVVDLNVDLHHESRLIARFFFDDILKSDADELFTYLQERGYTLGILTGDRKVNAERIFGPFKLPIYADCRPETKTALIQRHQAEGKLVGMVGDGMNDAPALALADIGIVFSGTENSASIEAADVAIFGRDAWLIRDAIHIGRRSYTVALQSIIIGIGLSVFGMLLASLGYISPLSGAIIQECIDIVVIVNALRSTY
ncbi:MAG: heavy metal translocating P-type ATPase [Minisyncoccota bacterium]